jgi:hypothetical protein
MSWERHRPTYTLISARMLYADLHILYGFLQYLLCETLQTHYRIHHIAKVVIISEAAQWRKNCTVIRLEYKDFFGKGGAIALRCRQKCLPAPYFEKGFLKDKHS